MTGGAIPIGASEGISYVGKAYTHNGWVPVTPNRGLKVEEIPALLAEYRGFGAARERCRFRRC
jgi:N-ethylmaleimide reductase